MYLCIERYKSKLFIGYMELKISTFILNVETGFFTGIVAIFMTGLVESLDSKVVLKDFILNE